MNLTIMRLTYRALLGRRRAALLLVLPLLMLVLAVTLRSVRGPSDDSATALVGGFGLATLIPLLGVIAGTGSIGPEIDDGSIIYLLSKPISRHVVILSKVVVAAVTTLVFGAVPVLIAGFVVAGSSHNLAVAYGAGAAAAGVTYAALFVMLAVLTRNAVVLGLLYALIWETTIAGVVPGARTVSVRQWATAISERIVGASAADVGLDAAVSLTVGVVLLVVVTVASTYYAGRALRSIRVTSDD